MIDLNKVGERVTDFRTQFSGVRPKHLKSSDAVTFKECAVSHSTMPFLPSFLPSCRISCYLVVEIIYGRDIFVASCIMSAYFLPFSHLLVCNHHAEPNEPSLVPDPPTPV